MDVSHLHGKSRRQHFNPFSSAPSPRPSSPRPAPAFPFGVARKGAFAVAEKRLHFILMAKKRFLRDASARSKMDGGKKRVEEEAGGALFPAFNANGRMDEGLSLLIGHLRGGKERGEGCIQP